MTIIDPKKLQAALVEAQRLEIKARSKIRSGSAEEAIEALKGALALRKEWQGNGSRDFLNCVDDLSRLLTASNQREAAAALTIWALAPHGWEPFTLDTLSDQKIPEHLETLQEVIAREIEEADREVEALRLH